MRKQLKSFLTALSSNEMLRKCVPFLADWHQAFVIGDTTRQAVIRTEYAGLKRSLFFWRFAPRKYSGGAALNLLGLQFARYAAYNLRYGLRRRRGELAGLCAQSGIVVEPDLLSPAAVTRILDFYRDHKADAHDHFQDFTELVISNTRGPASADPAYADLVQFILDECGIRSRGEDLTGLPVKVFPFIAVLHYKSYVDQTAQCDGQDTPHADVFFPSFKLFVYLNEVGEDNGAFRYLAGSHRFSAGNALNAYRDSVRFYFRGGKRQLYPVDASRGLEGKGYQWLAACGAPGDGVFFNVQGVHRRGDFRKDQFRERLVLLVDFRQVEVPCQRFAANV